MDEVFNPYARFLGLDDELASPSYYQLLRLRETESDPAKINAAADKATTRVRAQRPGEHITAWSELLDEIQAARACLLDAVNRAAYDQRLGLRRSESSAEPASKPVNPAPLAAPAMSFVPTAQQDFAYPPGVAPAGNNAEQTPSKPAGNPQPDHGYPPLMPQPAWSSTTAGPDSRTPLAMPTAVGPMAPVAYSWPTTPAGAAIMPPAALANPTALDPMAPVAFPTRSSPVPYATPVSVAAVATPAHQATAVAQVAALGLPTTPVPARARAKRPSRMPLLLVLGIGGSVAVLAVLLVAWGMSNGYFENAPLAENDNPEAVEPQPAIPSPQPQPAPEQPRPQPAQPEPMPEPEPVSPEPMPEPESSDPLPAPEPEKPEPEPPMPTAAELAELSRLLKEAKTALGDFTFDEAEAALEQAEQQAKLPEHQAMVSRLKVVADMAKKFRGGIEQTMSKLEAGEIIKVGASTEAAIVEASPDKLVIRIAGQNKTYSLDDMPLGLAVNLGERSFNAGDPKTRLLKGAYVVVDKRSDPAQLQKARMWWEEAQLSGLDIEEILPVLTDDYDFPIEDEPEAE